MANEACMLCTKKTDDVLNLGQKFAYRDVTAHHFCLLLSAEIQQSGTSKEGILGHLPNDIKKEMKRTKETTCYICNKKGANIRCCKKSCKLSFHLTCGLEAGCQNQFSGMFKSYCGSHIRIDEPTYKHKSDEECIICYDKMGKYHPINSIQSPCCSKNSWYHKKCLTKYAKTSGNSAKCLLCNNSDLFCKKISNRGIYIPKKRPEWKDWDPFYDNLQQYTVGPSCSAEECKCYRGRAYEPRYNSRKYSLIFCQSCGAKAMHRICWGDDKFTCEDCEIFLPDQSIHELQIDKRNDNRSLNENDTFKANIAHNDQSNENQNSNSAKFNLRSLSIVLHKHRPSQI